MIKDRININEADIETLGLLPGVGERLATRIVEYRENVHPFEEVIELSAVPGISERMVREIEALITSEIGSGVATLAGAQTAGFMAEMVDDDGVVEKIAGTLESAKDAVVDKVEDVVDYVSGDDEEVAEIEPVSADVPEIHAPDVDEDDEEDGIMETITETVESAKDAVVEKVEDVVDYVSGDDEVEPEPVLVPEPVTAEPTLTWTSPTASSSTASTAPPSTPPAPAMMVTNGSTGSRSWLPAIIGALAGAVLTLLALMLLNGGSLRFATQATRQEQQEQIDRLQQEIQVIENAMSGMSQTQNDAGNSIQQHQTDISTLQDASNALLSDFSVMEDTTVGMQGALDELNSATDELGERLDNVAVSAERSDNFLLGLQGLLNQVNGVEVESGSSESNAPMFEVITDPELLATPTTITPSSEITTTEIITSFHIVDPSATVEPVAEPTDAEIDDEDDQSNRPTRTPRPTATPLPLPTATPQLLPTATPDSSAPEE